MNIPTTIRRRTHELGARARCLHRAEEGGAYTLSFVMVVPVLMLSTCLIVETVLVMSAKLGTVYAAYSGARAAAVWCSATSWERARERIEQAAVTSFTPFASGSRAADDGASATSDTYVQAYTEHVDDAVSRRYVRAKLSDAHRSLRVSTDGPPAAWNTNITVTVEYDFSFQVPGVGRLLGEQGEDGRYYFRLRSQVQLQNEGPQNDAQELGIGYGTLE